MVFAGTADLAAGGSQVDLPAGTGSVVAEQGKPSNAEPLMPAPTLQSPADGAVLRVVNPRFVWAPTSGASSYFIELCADRGCQDLAYRGSTSSPEWSAESIPAGSYFWRASARSASGLDGFPSPTRALTIAGTARDSAGPTASLRLDGEPVEHAGVRYVPALVPLRIETADDSGGVASWEVVVNDEVISEAQIGAAWSGGPYRASLRASDEAGNQVASPTLEFTVDDAPPEIVIEPIKPSDMLGSTVLAGATLRRAALAARRVHADLTLSAHGGSWRPLTEAAGPVARSGSRNAAVFLLAVESNPFSTGEGPEVSGGDLLRVRAADSGAGVKSLELSMAAGPSGGWVLQAVASDRVGNAATTSWPLRSR